jgi:Peptidase inhibitor family I36
MLRRSIDRIVVPAVTAVLLLGMLATVALAAWDISCMSGKICNYLDTNLQGPLAATAGSDYNYDGDNYPNWAISINDSVSSMINYYSTKDVIWYHHAQAGTPYLCVNSYTAVIQLATGHNDKFSRHDVQANASVCP